MPADEPDDERAELRVGDLNASRMAADLQRIFEERAVSDPERLRDLVTKLRGPRRWLPYTL